MKFHETCACELISYRRLSWSGRNKRARTWTHQQQLQRINMKILSILIG